MRYKFLCFICLISLLPFLTLSMPSSVRADSQQTDSVIAISPSNVCFISTLYHDLLNRGPSSTELSDGLTYLSSNTRTQYASTLLAGSEYRTDLIQGWYQKFLGRSANNSEVSAGLSVFGTGGTDEQIIASIVGSNEYYNLPRVGGTNGGYINALYHDLLNRSPNPTELSGGLTYLSSNTRTQYASTLLAGSEYRTDLIQGWYHKFLGRSANSSEVSAGLSVFGTGGTDEQIIASIVGSTEYFDQAGICKVYLPLIMR